MPKNVHLRFEVSTNVPKPFEVYWQVVNTGPEAEAKNDLRGDFYNSDGAGGIVRWERTAYAGIHWVEGFIIKDGVCVAKPGSKYVKVSLYVKRSKGGDAHKIISFHCERRKRKRITLTFRR